MEFCTIGLTACCHKRLYIKHGYIASPMDWIVTKLWNAYMLLQTCTYEGVMIVRVCTTVKVDNVCIYFSEYMQQLWQGLINCTYKSTFPQITEVTMLRNLHAGYSNFTTQHASIMLVRAKLRLRNVSINKLWL